MFGSGPALIQMGRSMSNSRTQESCHPLFRIRIGTQVTLVLTFSGRFAILPWL